MKKILVIGGKGFVGSNIVKVAKKKNILLDIATRNDNLEEKIKSSDFVIHSANSASRYKAKIDPKYDFIESVEKTNYINKLCLKYQKKLTLISSISARTQLHIVYGMNRKSCEYIVSDNQLIVRLGYMFSYDKLYGALKDIYENNTVYLDKESSYSFSNVIWNAEKIVEYTLKEKKGVFELGSKSSISLNEISKILGSKSKFVGEEKDIQIANYIEDDNPTIDEFRNYLKYLKDGK